MRLIRAEHKFDSYTSYRISLSGGIGRRTGLKSRGSKERVSSTPTLGT
jgi:hypothetical protein